MMALDLSCAFATSMESHEHVRIAEDLGYNRAWFYDSPALYPDVWVQLCCAAERTRRIGLGPGVIVPSLRHPMVNAAGIASLVSVAGSGRIAVGIGSGFTGRLTMGRRPMKWSDVAQYVRVLRALLHGEEAEWEGARCAVACGMKHPQRAPLPLGLFTVEQRTQDAYILRHIGPFHRPPAHRQPTGEAGAYPYGNAAGTRD